MGAEAAVNAVYANKIAAIEDEAERAAFVAARRAEYDEDIDIVRLASELVVDAIVLPSELRERAGAPVRGSRGQGPVVQPPPARRHPRLSPQRAGSDRLAQLVRELVLVRVLGEDPAPVGPEAEHRAQP